MTPTHSAVCGLFCKACGVYIAGREDPERLKIIAERFGGSPENMKCDGCRSDRRSIVCRDCEFVACAEKKGLLFCGACDMYPCEKLNNFKREMPHRIELWEDNARIQAVGPTVWSQEKEAHYSCKACGTLNTAYDLACRKCGNKPASDFIAEHEDAVRAYRERISNREA